jgi:hypothetical protein
MGPVSRCPLSVQSCGEAPPSVGRLSVFVFCIPASSSIGNHVVVPSDSESGRLSRPPRACRALEVLAGLKGP